MMERKARQKGWSRTPRNRWLSTCVTNLMTNPKGMIEEMGNIPDEPIPEIGDKLTIDDRHFTVVDVYLHDGRECDIGLAPTEPQIRHIFNALGFFRKYHR